MTINTTLAKHAAIIIDKAIGIVEETPLVDGDCVYYLEGLVIRNPSEYWPEGSHVIATFHNLEYYADRNIGVEWGFLQDDLESYLEDSGIVFLGDFPESEKSVHAFNNRSLLEKHEAETFTLV